MLSILPLLFSDVLIFLLGEGNGNPLRCSCLENPRDGEAWWATVYGVAQSRTRLKRLRSSSLSSSSENMSNPCSPCFFFVFFFKFYPLEDVSLSLSFLFSVFVWLLQVFLESLRFSIASRRISVASCGIFPCGTQDVWCGAGAQ